MTMKLTIELDTSGEMSDRERGILQAIAGEQYIAIDLNAAEDIAKSLKSKKQPKDDSIDEQCVITDPTETCSGDAAFINQNLSLNQSAATVEQITQAEVNAGNLNQPEDIDAVGMPWDERINPKSRGKIKTGKRAGCWKYIKQLDVKQPGLIEQVEAENKARLIKQVHDPETEAVEFKVGDDGQAIAAQTFGAPNQQQVNETETETTALDFSTFMFNKITPRLEEKPDFANSVNAVLAAHGLKSLTELISKQDLIPQIDLELEALWITV